MTNDYLLFFYLPSSLPLPSHLSISTTTMSKAIISPSVLASDLSNLTAECKRMIAEGADWLHMGASLVTVHMPRLRLTLTLLADVMDGYASLLVVSHCAADTRA